MHTTLNLPGRVAEALMPQRGAVRTSPTWRPQSIAERIHMRAAVTGSRQVWQPGRWALRSWQRAAWRTFAGHQALRSLGPRWSEKYAQFTGVSPAEQHRALAHLVTHCGISPRDAYWFDLVRDNAESRWRQYVFASELQWNLAASEVLWGNRAEAVASVRLLQDKKATAAILRRIGVATPPTRTLPRNARISALEVAQWLREWPGLFCKPQWGSAGRGTLAIAVEADDVTANGQPSSLTDVADALQRLLASEPYVVQPLLRNAFGEGMRDVVTLRVVTRWFAGHGPELFCVILEWPNRCGDSGHEMFTLASDGSVVSPTMPLWIPGFNVADSEPPVAGIDDFAEITAAALDAHQAIGRLFSVAWDVALTDQGPTFLEGNSGYGTRIPQVASGGLLPAD